MSFFPFLKKHVTFTCDVTLIFISLTLQLPPSHFYYIIKGAPDLDVAFTYDVTFMSNVHFADTSTATAALLTIHCITVGLLIKGAAIVGGIH